MIFPFRHFVNLSTFILFALLVTACTDRENGNSQDGATPELSPETLASQVAASLTEEEILSLSDELRVRPGELALFDYWDAVRTARQPMQALGQLQVSQVLLPQNASGTMAEVFAKGGEWPAMLKELQQTHGYTLTWSHFQHESFDSDSNPPSSMISAEFHFGSGLRRARTILKGEMAATWSVSGPESPGAPPFTNVVLEIDELTEGQEPVFHELTALEANPTDGKPAIAAPMLVRDLNRDHYPEVILLGSNKLLWNQANCTFVEQPLLSHAPAAGFRVGAFGEFTDDVFTDLVVIDSLGKLSILPGAPAGAFVQDLIPITDAPIMEQATQIAVADIDSDGDSDLYIAQDKPLFVGGQMPSPVDNALSGNPDFLLRNDGSFQFTDITDSAGLEEKRLRRTRDAGFCDFDGDGDADLILASAFAPVDVLENRDGRFSDVSGSAVAGKSAPLIANRIALGDINFDGLEDFAVAAVSSPSGARIESARSQSDSSSLSSPEGAQSIPITESSSRLAHNDERTLSGAESITSRNQPRRFEMVTNFADAGWANDLALFDYDNDGDLDTYIANGNISGNSTRDYDLYFWQRELRAATAMEDPVIAILFTDSFRPEPFQGLNEGQISWQGHQANRFYQNIGTTEYPQYHEVGFLAGAALTADSLATEAADLDLDGKIDLLVVTQSWKSNNGTLVPIQSLTVLRNENANNHAWIGFKLDNLPASMPLTGITVTLESGGQRLPFRFSEGASTFHLGLGGQKAPDRATIHWPDGTAHYIDAPKPRRYISVAFALD